MLSPWDAGTDDGISYESPNKPSRPHRPIRPLNVTDDEKSPFYSQSGGSIKPFARVVIERLSLKVRNIKKKVLLENFFYKK